MDDVELLQQNGDEVHVGLLSVSPRGGEVESVENVGEGDDAGGIADVDGEERTLDLSEETLRRSVGENVVEGRRVLVDVHRHHDVMVDSLGALQRTQSRQIQRQHRRNRAAALAAVQRSLRVGSRVQVQFGRKENRCLHMTRNKRPNRRARRSRRVPHAVKEGGETTHGGGVVVVRKRYVLMERLEGETVLLEQRSDHFELVVEIVIIHLTEAVLNGICIGKLHENVRKQVHLHQEDPQKDERQYSSP